jgi:anti-anti-sigma factor
MEIDIQAGAGAATLTLRGRLDAAWSGPVADALQKTVREGCLDLRLELAGVSYISSAGIRILLSQWKEMRRAQGRMSITSISTEVERILKLAGLGMLLEASVLIGKEVSAATPESKTQSWSGPGFAGEIEELSPQARWQGRLVGAANAPINLSAIASARLEDVSLPASTLALGFGALGHRDAEGAPRLGEFLAAGGCAVHLSPTGENQSDYAVTEGILAPEARLAQGLVAEGGFARMGKFEVAGEATSVALSDLAAGMLAAAGSPQIAFAAVVETAALVGACLRRLPDAPGAENIFAFPTVRDWLTFTAEPAYANTTALIVGVATQPRLTTLAGFTRPSGAEGSPRLHAHAAAFHFRPIRHGKLPFAETITGLFDAGRILGVLHLLPDRRPELGAGESRFHRGVCWFSPLDI